MNVSRETYTWNKPRAYVIVSRETILKRIIPYVSRETILKVFTVCVSRETIGNAAIYFNLPVGTP